MENLTPEHAFQLKVLISGREQGLSGVLVTVNFIEYSVVNKLTEDSLIATGLVVTFQEELVTVWFLNDVVQNNTDFVAETFIVKLVALFKNHLEDGLERWYNLGVSSKLCNSGLTDDLDEIP